MKRFIFFLLLITSVQVFAQKQVKNLTYFYYKLNSDQDFTNYLQAKRAFNNRKIDFVLPASKEAVKEITENQHKILKNPKNYAQFLTKYGMKNANEYAILWYNQSVAFKLFLKKNKEFNTLTDKEQSNIIDKWYYAPVVVK
jgi:hypothetical protein